MTKSPTQLDAEIAALTGTTTIWRREEWKALGKPTKVVWKYVRGVNADEAERWLAIFQKDEPHETFVISPTKPRGKNVKVKFFTGPGMDR